MSHNPRLDALFAEVAEANAALQPPSLEARLVALLRGEPMTPATAACTLGCCDGAVAEIIARHPHSFVQLGAKVGVVEGGPAVRPVRARAIGAGANASAAAKGSTTYDANDAQ